MRHRTATGTALIELSPSEKGCPILDLVPDPTSVRINGRPSSLLEVHPPSNEVPVRALDQVLPKGSSNRLEIRYPITSDTLKFGDDWAQFGLFMDDLGPRGYLERHAPANLEFDSSPARILLEVVGTEANHRLFSNASKTTANGLSWDLEFPSYFTCSSYFLHLTNREMAELHSLFKGVEKEVPILIYGESPKRVKKAMTRTIKVMRELEETYGPYAHERLVVYITEDMEEGDEDTGMEYCGATMTELNALDHELTHSWFARGVIPANGNAGWIDEAIASWRDNRYKPVRPRHRPPVNLAGFPPYRRYTPDAAYTKGRLFLSELDYRFARKGGLRPLLSKLFLEKRRKVITSTFFQHFLERESGEDLSAWFNRYVYGRDTVMQFSKGG